MDKWCNGLFDKNVWSKELFDTRQDAIRNGIEQYKNAAVGLDTMLFCDKCDFKSKSFYIGRVSKYNPSIGADEIITLSCDTARNLCEAESLRWRNDLENISNVQKESLDRVMNTQFKAWLKLNNIYPEFYSIVDIEKIDVGKHL